MKHLKAGVLKHVLEHLPSFKRCSEGNGFWSPTLCRRKTAVPPFSDNWPLRLARISRFQDFTISGKENLKLKNRKPSHKQPQQTDKWPKSKTTNFKSSSPSSPPTSEQPSTQANIHHEKNHSHLYPAALCRFNYSGLCITS